MPILKKENPPSHNLANSVGRNTIFGIGANVVQMATRLVTVPIVIHHLGLGGYGIWNIIMLTATYMRFGAVGAKTAFQKYVAEATGNGEYDRATRLLSTGCAVLFVISLAGLVPAALLSGRIAAAMGVPQEFLKSSAGAISLLAVILMMANVGSAFEAIVTGGHRIDLVRKFSTVLTIAEAIAIVLVLHLGYGLFAMAAVMGASELIYVSCCYFASHRVVPEIRLGIRHISKDVSYELFRFAGSYQMVNVLEVLYASIIPIAVLKNFGADMSGVYALVNRVVGCASVVQEAFLSPILSSGSMVYASGSAEKMQALVAKAFKVSLGLTLFPFGFIAVFGPTIAYAWTGQTSPAFRGAFWLICIRALFAAFSLLALVLYRVSGKAILDNIRQVLRIVVLLGVALLSSKLGFYGVLGGLAFSELIGMIFMLYALTETFHLFRARSLLPDTLRLATAAVIILAVGVLASYIPLPFDLHGRLSATLRLGEIGMACLLIAWPSLLRTGAVSAAEGAALFSAVFPRRIANQVLVQNAGK
jgi:O-antigen/teichoic acid export membrane protein